MPRHPSIFNRDNPLEPPEDLTDEDAHLEAYNTHIEIYEDEDDETPHEIWIPMNAEERGNMSLAEYFDRKLDEIGIDREEIAGYQLKHGRGRSQLKEEWSDFADLSDSIEHGSGEGEYTTGGGMVLTMR